MCVCVCVCVSLLEYICIYVSLHADREANAESTGLSSESTQSDKLTILDDSGSFTHNIIYMRV